MSISRSPDAQDRSLVRLTRAAELHMRRRNDRSRNVKEKALQVALEQHSIDEAHNAMLQGMYNVYPPTRRQQVF